MHREFNYFHTPCLQAHNLVGPRGLTTADSAHCVISKRFPENVLQVSSLRTLTNFLGQFCHQKVLSDEKLCFFVFFAEALAVKTR